MLPASTKGGGKCAGFPDVCKVPAPPAPFVPTPFPNIAQLSSASQGTCATKVKIDGKPTVVKTTEIPRSQGDEAGTLKGMVSQVVMDKATYKVGSTKVRAQGQPVVTVLKQTTHNGSNANIPAGIQVEPSQTKVMIK